MSMRLLLYIVFVFLFLFLFLGCKDKETTTQLPSQETTLPPLLSPQENKEQSVIIEMKDDGFFPKSLSLAAGTTVTFVNKGSTAIWPASDYHPTHTLYPGSGIRKCASGETIFDACQEIPPGGAWSFRFTEKGSWGYHDHRNPGMRGIIVVT